MDELKRRKLFGPLAVLMAVCALGGSLVAGVISPSVASASEAHWSGTTAFDPSIVDSVSCPTTTFCLAVDFQHALVYDGTSWSAPQPVSGSTDLTSVSCTSATFCAAVDFYGDAFTYDGSTWSQPTPIHTFDQTEGDGLISVSCASPSFCATVSIGGDGMTYDGTSWTPSAAIDDPDRGSRGADLLSVSCPSSSFCVAVDGYGNAMTYDGSSWSSPATIDASDDVSANMISVSCPSTSFCMALSRDGYVLTYDGSAWSDPVAVGLTPSEGSLDFLSCASSTFCVALDEVGQIHDSLIYDGTSWTKTAPFPDAHIVGGLSCATDVFCMASDNDGSTSYVITYEGPTSAPQLAVTPSPLPAAAGPVTYSVVVGDGTAPAPTGSVTVSDNLGGTCDIPSLGDGGGQCDITEDAASGPYTVTATYSGDGTYLPGTARITVAGAVSSGGTASSGTAGVTATASGGTDGVDTITTGHYSSDPVGDAGFTTQGAYFDVVLSPDNTFASDTILDCDLNGGSQMLWWDPSSNGGSGGWESVLGNPGPTLLDGSPNCISVTLDDGTSPSLSQLTGTVFGVGDTVPSTLTITTRSLPPATRGTAYAPVTLQEAGAAASTHPYVTTFKWKKVSLPKGLKLSKDGVLSGAPSKKLVAGSSSVVVQVTDTVTTLNGKKKVKTHTTAQATIPLTIG